MLDDFSVQDLEEILAEIQNKKDLPKSQIALDFQLINDELYSRTGLMKYLTKI